MATELSRPEYAESTAEAVARIMACADIAVDSIGRQAEREVGEIWAEAEARPAREALERRQRLANLRAELAEQAAALALSYASILEQIGDVDRMLVGQESAGGAEAEPRALEADPRVAAIRMTLRERTRVHDPAAPEGQQMQDAPWVERVVAPPPTWPPVEQPEAPVQHQGQPAVGEAWHPSLDTEFAHLEPEEPRWRPWRLWKRAA